MSISYEEKYDEKHAIIIGINNYEYAGPLEYAENDAKIVKDTLVSKYSYKEENIVLLLNENATKENILDNFNAYIDNIGKDDSLLFYFAGHGITKMNIEGNEGFLIPYDGNEKNYNTLISWNEILRISKLIISKHIFFVLDACYSGLALTRNASFGRTRFLNEMLTKPARQLLTAGASDQTVKDGGGIIPNHSLFTSYFVKAIEGEAKNENDILTANMVMAYVCNAVANNTYSRQTPKYGYTYGEGDFIFDFGKGENNNEKNSNILVRIPTPIEDSIGIENNHTERLKELLSTPNNKIKIYELVNEELRNVISELNSFKNSIPSTFSDEQIKVNIEQYNRIIRNLIEYVILLVYYGQIEYINLVKKIIKNIQINDNSNSGNTTYINLFEYPCFVIYFTAILTCIEASNIDLLKSLIDIENDKKRDYLDTNLLICRLVDTITKISDNFKVMNNNKEYKYQFSEYLFGIIQPILDELLFLGEDYENIYVETEQVISLFYAVDNYKKCDFCDTWGYSGRYIYKFENRNIDISKKESFKLLDMLGIFDFKKSSKDEFIKHFNHFLSNKWF